MGDEHHRLMNEATGLALQRASGDVLTSAERNHSIFGSSRTRQHWELLRVD